MNIEVLKNASDRVGTSLKKNITIEGEPFLKRRSSGYIETQDELLIKHHFPTAELVTIPKAGHWLHAENPTAFAHTINSWWDVI